VENRGEQKDSVNFLTSHADWHQILAYQDTQKKGGSDRPMIYVSILIVLEQMAKCIYQQPLPTLQARQVPGLYWN